MNTNRMQVVNSMRYHTISTSLSVISRPNKPVKPANNTLRCNCINPFFVSSIPAAKLQKYCLIIYYLKNNLYLCPQNMEVKDRYRRFGEWKLQPHQVAPLSEEEHECATCGTRFEGNYCPRCGQSAKIGRYSFKKALLLFLDVWGVGNRGMFRSIRDLILRPGYMIRDYLRGMQMAYFPPFKMFFLLIALSLVVDSGLNIQGINRSKLNEAEEHEIVAGFVAMVYITNMYIIYEIVPSFLCFSVKAEMIYGMLAMLLALIPIKQLSGYSYPSTIWRIMVAFIPFIILFYLVFIAIGVGLAIYYRI